MGPHHLVEVVRAQAERLDRMLPSARDEIREELLLLAFRYNEFAGWLYQDAGNPEQAMRYTDRAVDYALEIGSPREMSYVLMRKADIAADLGNPDRALGLTQAALREARQCREAERWSCDCRAARTPDSARLASARGSWTPLTRP